MFNEKFEELVEEGLAKIVIPKRQLYLREDGSLEPAWMPVFYNPVAAISRDFTTAFLNAVFNGREFFFADILAGCGVRGVRIAIEANGTGIINDVDPRAFRYAHRNVILNNLVEKLDVYNHEANTLLNNLTFTGVVVDYVDIDPYGSPSPYIESAIKPLGKVSFLGVTATDTAPLTCSHYRKARYRYWVNCFRPDFEKELGARVLIGHIVMKASSLEVALVPLLTVYHKHFYRVFYKSIRSGVEALSIVEKCVGYVWYCQGTLERGYATSYDDIRDIKCSDGSIPNVMGNTWICELGDLYIVKDVERVVANSDYMSRTTRKIVGTIVDELAINTPYYRVDKLYSLLKRNMPPIEKIIECLRDVGVKASRTHFDPRGLRADIEATELVKLLGARC